MPENSAGTAGAVVNIAETDIVDNADFLLINYT